MTQDTPTPEPAMNNSLDVNALVQYTQAISRTLSLDELLLHLTQMVLRYSTGDRCAVIVGYGDGHKDKNMVREMSTTDTATVHRYDLITAECLPIQLIQHVRSTTDPFVMERSDTPIPVEDDYLNQQHPICVLCLPLTYRDEVMGTLYLEKRTDIGFEAEQVAIVNLLVIQAANAMGNMHKGYQLSDLIAGIFSDIKNPLGFVFGNIRHLEGYIQEIVEYLEMCEQAVPPERSDIKEKREEIDLDFLLEDLPKILASVRLGRDGVKNVIRKTEKFLRNRE